MESGNLLRLVDTLCASGRAAEAHHRVALLLFSAVASPSLSRSHFDALLRRLLRARTPLLTLRLLQHAAPALAPSLPNYNRLLALLCRTDQPFPLLDEMPGRGLVPTSLTRTFLVKALLRDRDVDAAMDHVHNHLWQGTANADDSKFQEDTNAAFANLVQCLCAEGFFHIIFQIAEEMPQRRRHVDDEFAYAQMIDSLRRTGQHHGASRIVYIMRKRGVRPSSVSYNCIVHGLCTSQKPGGRLRAHQLVMEGVSFGYLPREETYKVLVDQLCRENELSKAKDVLELMLQPQSDRDKSGGGVDEETRTRIYNIFLGALRVVDNHSEQLAVLMSMLQAGCKPDVITMNTVIHGFSKAGRSHEARRILDDMLSGKFCAPDVVTFTTLIAGYLEAGDHAEALDVLHTLMPRRRCSPTVVTYNCVLKGLSALQQVDTAMQTFEEMKANNVAADSVTHTLVIKGLCDAGRLEKAKAFWDDIVWPSGIHDDYVYSAIFGGLCKQGKLEQACDFLYELVDSGISPSLVCYNILIDTACKEGSKKLAYQLVKEMRRNGLTPDAVSWRILGKLHHCENEEPAQRHHLPNSDVAQSSADDRVEPFISKESETPLLSSSKHLHETNENRNKVKMKGDDCAEGEFGCSTEMTEESLDKYEPAKEQEDHMMDISRYGIAGGVTQEDSLTKPCRQSIIREPLSEVTRKVFGLL
ncbi:hypothetical protein PR202_ga28817 [Eleusine coracana subsp. coracana]|uniref:Pentatricopeptide repeat-containing protein n=1 Tax=Eleusine coracana subsp. coracana TaxID=191504 RepID=A0AAV5DJS5_ELECO|nr:hypothetical protein PR202_ga28817 [Eleusine coracana subsp. coracana]